MYSPKGNEHFVKNPLFPDLSDIPQMFIEISPFFLLSFF
jgi:hypothetical protein